MDTVKNPKIIAFAGLARAGKTTAAKALAEYLNDPNRGDKWAEIVSFAAPLKNSLKSMGVHKENHPEQYRYLAQTIGATMRAVNTDWWVNLFDSYVSQKSCDVLIIDDMRYLNELQWVIDRGGDVYFVDGSERLNLADPMYTHESETMAVQMTKSVYRGLDDDTKWERPTELTYKRGSHPIPILYSCGDVKHLIDQVLEECV
jgi:DNA polymerase III delta prime subunit